jgi:hypothetical protein
LPLPVPPPGLFGTLKVITKVSGGNSIPSDFNITVSGNGPKPASFAGSSLGSTITLKPGKYSVSASSVSGYTTSYSSGCSVSIAGAKNINLCTITNKYTSPPGSTTFLNVVTKVDNTNGGIKKPSDFTITVSGNSPKPSTFSGSASGTSVGLKAGVYKVTVSAISGYDATYSSGCSGTASGGQTLSCTVENVFQTIPLGKIIVVKNVINDDRGTKKPSDFMLFVTGNSPSPNNFQGSASGTSVSVRAGKYVVVEASVSGYKTTYSSDCSGVINAGETIKCTVTNDDIPPTPFIDTETVKLGKSTFVSDALRPLVDVGPSSNIIGGHVSLSSPTGSSSDHLKLVAAEITDAGVQHAVAVNLTKTLDITPTAQSLYHTDLRSTFAGINPFTGAQDRVTHFTDLLLWNNGTSSIVFSGDDYFTTEVIYFAR